MGQLVKTGSKYSNEDRRRAVVEFYVHGLMSKVSESTGIPETTLATWKNKSPWWDEMVAEVRSEKDEEFDAHLTKLIDTSFEEAEDRIKNGDFRLVKTKKAIKHDDGSLEVSEDYELKRIPMGGKELIVGGAVVYDKQRLHRNQPTTIRAETATAEIQSFAQ